MYPAVEGGHLGVDAGAVGPGTAEPVAGDPRQQPTPVRPLGLLKCLLKIKKIYYIQ